MPTENMSPQDPTAGYCPKNYAKGHSHSLSDYSYWAGRNQDTLKHPVCGSCGYVDKSRIVDSWAKTALKQKIRDRKKENR
jgi:hypothetical protein